MGVYVFDAAFLYDELMRDADDRESGARFRQGSHPASHRLRRACLRPRFCRQLRATRPTACPIGATSAPSTRTGRPTSKLTDWSPELNLYDEDWPIWTYQEQLPPAKFVFNDDGRRGMAVDSLVAGGCIISGSAVQRSVLFSNVRVHDYATVEDCVILPNVDIGRGAVLRRVVVDKHCKVPAELIVGLDPEADRRRFSMTPLGVTLVVPEMLGQHVHHLR